MSGTGQSRSVGVTVAAFYKFVSIEDAPELRGKLVELSTTLGIKGTILLAEEGINATVSGDGSSIALLLAELRKDARFGDLAVKFSYSSAHPFRRLKVKIKREIVTFGVPEAKPSTATGTYVEPADWNALISEPGVLIIDTRNTYEFEVGTFEGAQNPGTRAFREFPDYVAAALGGDRGRKIAMFCTGGIRCEKASAFLIREGFTRVYQLNGGILNYLERITPGHSMWRGECFVFDARVALGHGVVPGHFTLCSGCGHPIRCRDEEDGTGFCGRCWQNASATVA